MTSVDKKEQIVTWNGDPVHWQEYVKRVRLQYEKTEWRKRGLLGAELASRLTGRAWDVASAELNHDKLQRPDGAAYLLHFLEERLCKAPIPDTGQRLEEFFMKLRRTPGSSMAEWAAQLRESYRRLQRAMARQRKDQADRFGSPGEKTPKSPSHKSHGSSSPQRKSDATTPARSAARSTFGFQEPAAGATEPEEPQDPGRPDPTDGGYDAVPQSETASNPGHGYGGNRWTDEQWTEWYAERDRSARLSVLSSIGNKLDLGTMERAMRDQEEELLLAEAQRSRGDLQRPRRSFWVEQDSQWGLLGEEVQDDLEESPICWIGDRLPPEVYPREEHEMAWSTWLPDGHEMHWDWFEDDFYATDADGCYWSWADTKSWLDLEDYLQSNPSDGQQTQEISPLSMTVCEPSRSVLMVTGVEECSDGDEVDPDMGEVLATVALQHPGHAVIDTGATETIASLEALEEVMQMRAAKFGPEEITVHQRHKKFRFGNGQEQRAASFVELPQFLAGSGVKLGVHTLDAPGVPLLLSVKTLQSLKAVIDVDEGMICFTAVRAEHWLPLKRGPNGHLLLDLTTDWYSSEAGADGYVQSQNSHSPSQLTYKDAAASDVSLVEQAKVDEVFSAERHDQHGACGEGMHEKVEQVHEVEGVVKDVCGDLQSRPESADTSSPNANSGSSMLRGLPVLAAIAVATTSSPTWNGSIHREEPRDRGDLCPKGQGQDSWACLHSHPNSREVRHVEGRRPGCEGWEGPRLPLLGQSCQHAGGPGQSERAQRPWYVESLQQVQAQDPICAGIWCDRSSPTSRTSGTRRLAPDAATALERVGKTIENDVKARENLNSKMASTIGAEESLKNKLKKLEADRLKATSSAPVRPKASADQTQVVTETSKKAAKRENATTAEEDYINAANEVMEEFFGKSSDVELMEVCCPTDSRLVETFLNKGRSAIRIGLPAIDLSKKKGLEELLRMIEKHRPAVLWFSLPCGPYSPIQELFNENTPEKLQQSELRKARSRRLMANGITAARRQVSLGGEIGWEWPRDNRGWNVATVRVFFNELLAKGMCHEAKLDGCAYGLKNSDGFFLRKPWKVKTTSPTLAAALQRACPGNHEHRECLGGKTARDSGFYPQALCDTIQKTVREMVNTKVENVFPVFDAQPLQMEKKPELPEPLTANERKEAEKLLSKLHRRTGHPSNSALASTLRHRGAHYEVVEMAKRHQCPECQELRMVPKGESRNATGPEVVKGLQDTWVRHYGLPGMVRMDPEGAFRSHELGQWGEERGVQLLPCAAEAHGQIGLVERAIQTIKNTTRQLVQGQDVSPWDAIQQACLSHNELARVEGFSPFQWAFGKQPTSQGHMHDRGHDLPFLTSSAVAGSSMAANLRLRVQAQQTFLRQQAMEQVSRALNIKTRRAQTFVPGDLIFFKRVKPPAQPAAAARMSHKLWRWYGPGRVLATETRTDGVGEVRKPSNVIWIVSHGRLKRCSPEQLRHASERERLLAEGNESPATTWTFHSIAQTLFKGEYEILDQHVFPEDSEAVAAPRAPRRARSLSRSRARSLSRSVARRVDQPKMARTEKTPQNLRNPSDGGGARQEVTEENKTLQDLYDETSGGGLNLGRYLDDPMYAPAPSAVTRDRPTSELFQQPLFKKQRMDLYGNDDGDEWFIGHTTSSETHTLGSDRLVCTFDLGLPERQSDWRRLRRSPEAYYVKKVRNTEIKWHLLSPEEKLEFEEAKRAEVKQWLTAQAVKRVQGFIPKKRIISMRWVLTRKESGAAKGRIVLIGYQDPDLSTIESSAPTMSRRTRQVALQMSSVRRWRVLKADVKAAFLQGHATEADRQLYAMPVKELAQAMNLQDNEAVQVIRSCYGLVTAPASWFSTIRATLAELNFHQCKTDPCMWTYHSKVPGKGVIGYICAHVDDFLISGCEETDEWVAVLEQFYAKFRWSPWEFSTFSHCGVMIREESDFSFNLDHSSFCESIDQVEFQSRPDHELLTGEELTQLRGALGALQWRAHQTAPHLSARLGQLQSEISKATVGTAKSTNRLIRECFNSRHLSTRINQLHVEDPTKVVFVAWSDAALANRIDLGSTGGFLVAAASPEILKGERAPLSFMAWRSSKLQRKARSSLAAEAQALAEAEQVQAALWEVQPLSVNSNSLRATSRRNLSESLIIDANVLGWETKQGRGDWSANAEYVNHDDAVLRWKK
ncbi:unnamed protein product [Cladocopium goreaui]|uniref:Gag-Pol-p199 n=1 Tax=Cladocopium goreaui TaxID=2562237 RepID=A0A9P1GGY6_9DINO|nr:unnamed protein product [Cladocopium goreaui]